MTVHSERPPEDLTARARIRDAALRLFAERGIGPATIRDIAGEAAVSPGLVRHHFGSKQALRDACDRYAMDRTNQLREQLFTEGRLSDQSFLTSAHPDARLLQRYLVRSMMDGSEAAAEMFEESVRLGEQWVARQGVQTRDPKAYSAVICAMQMGVFLMRDQLSKVLGVDVDTLEGYVRMNRGFVDAAANTMLTPEQAAAMHTALDGLVASPPAAPRPRPAATTSEPDPAGEDPAVTRE